MPKEQTKKIELKYVVGCKTQFHGATDFQGSRVSATHLLTKKRITRPWKHELNSEDNHAMVAAELLASVELLAAPLHNGGFVFMTYVAFPRTRKGDLQG